MENIWLVRFYHPEAGPRVGVQRGDRVYDVTMSYPTVGMWLQQSAGNVETAIAVLLRLAEDATSYEATLFDRAPLDGQAHWLAPVDTQDVWAAGVTYERSREARQEEAQDGGDVYARVYSATRPELFFKAHGAAVVGQYGQVGIRSDAAWSVPEPELTLIINPALEVVGVTAGNDMSSRDIEGENPLYLPQAKVYTASCSLGHGILLGKYDDFPTLEIIIAIRRADEEVFSANVNTSRIRRTIADLVGYLGRSQQFPEGVALMTGTGIVPPTDFTLQAGDDLTISIEGVSNLHNIVVVV